MNIDKEKDNKRALNAKSGKEAKEKFLSEEQRHILHLTARILKRTVTDSDDEYSIALMAVSEAIDSYDEDKGAFWNYASLVIRSRIIDEMRRQGYSRSEIYVSPDVFNEKSEEEDDINISIRQEVQKKTAVYVDNNLKNEIEALSDELSEYGIDLFELPEYAPKSKKTKESCKELILAFFLPPPLVEALRKTKNLPVKELLMRCKVSRKLIDRHRKYLLASIVVKAGDYQGIEEYIL